MTPARFNLLKARYAPQQTAVAVDWRTDGQTIALSCGHSAQLVAHCHVERGDKVTCYACGADRVRNLPEFIAEGITK